MGLTGGVVLNKIRGVPATKKVDEYKIDMGHEVSNLVY
jgi:hypothetical protein